MPNISDIKIFFYKLIVLDYLLANSDRHYGNFGFMRNANSLEWLGPAPIFDSSNSLYFDKSETFLSNEKNLKEDFISKSFESKLEIQLLKYKSEIRNLRIDYSALKEKINNITKLFFADDLISESRAKLLSKILLNRTKKLIELLY